MEVCQGSFNARPLYEAFRTNLEVYLDSCALTQCVSASNIVRNHPSTVYSCEKADASPSSLTVAAASGGLRIASYVQRGPNRRIRHDFVEMLVFRARRS